jgi:glycosyltransferase involved in cell wall biosynthesis
MDTSSSRSYDVILEARKPPKSLRRVLPAADAFIMSSNSEGLPMSLLEAFSMGLPAIVTDVGGMAEVVRLAQAGFTVPVTDPAGMAAAILRLAACDSERKQFSMNAEEAFHSRFNLQTMAYAYMDHYRNTPRVRQGPLR